MPELIVPLLAIPFALSCAENENCDTPVHPPLGSYTVVESRYYRPELIGAPVDIEEDTVTIRYVLDDGSKWHVTYDLVVHGP